MPCRKNMSFRDCELLILRLAVLNGMLLNEDKLLSVHILFS